MASFSETTRRILIESAIRAENLGFFRDFVFLHAYRAQTKNLVEGPLRKNKWQDDDDDK